MSDKGGILVEGLCMAVALHSLRFKNPGAPVLVVLHGLLGSSRNWSTIGRTLQDRFDVHVLDLRNHGSSPHSDAMRWSEMCEDLQAYLDLHELESIELMGHSLGGKVAMRYACERPEVVERLMIVDIAAKPYPPYHDNEFRAMKRIPVAELANRKEAEELLEPMVLDWALRQFLLTNLAHDEASGTFRWQVNLEALHASLPHIRQNSLLETDRYEGPVLLVRGANSDFIDDDDANEMLHWFPHLHEEMVPSAGHNVHVENRKGFLEVLDAWL
ncbi:MAG TPA: alpha/beta hydrolase [Opitutae bacterium]|nr:alpha/beta hydrolase [Puniceicoccaceae bacterium]HBR92546.1 alpha/beta hydrolase [Opitutae bacterium]|tara:strand:+ start:159 stop:974 length:816 start_codon:yes stop_codon:yes gene_type:complete